MADRGAFSALEFRKCSRGFTLFATPGQGMIGDVYAFDRIEDVAGWLVEQYGEPRPTPEEVVRAMNEKAVCRGLNP